MELCPCLSGLPPFGVNVAGDIYWEGKTLDLGESLRCNKKPKSWLVLEVPVPHESGDTLLQGGSFNVHQIGTKPVLLPSAFQCQFPEVMRSMSISSSSAENQHPSFALLTCLVHLATCTHNPFEGCLQMHLWGLFSNTWLCYLFGALPFWEWSL